MKVVRAETRTVDLPLREGYRIAGRTITCVRNFFLRLDTDRGLTGWGSAAPAEEVTGESEAMCLEALEGPLRELALQADPLEEHARLAERARSARCHCPAARAALDIALWDLAGKSAGRPLLNVWGGRWRPLPTSTTIGVCDTRETLEAAERWIARGRFKVLKVKIGEDVDLDVERLRALRQMFRGGIRLRADANQGYTLEQARAFLRGVEGADLELLEQPLKAADLDGLRRLREESRVPIFADEAARSEEEAAEVIRRGAAHGINVKLMKCGGPTAARGIHERARAAAVPLMLGCNDESRLSMAAAAHLALALPGFGYADLDGHLDLARDPAAGGLDIRDGMLIASERPGLGVDVSL
jgi:L-alanine-DL-glutamate epimerase-like enolase superfamily enzyme